MSGSIYEELGVKPVINARGTTTHLGGNTPSPVVRAAMEEAEEYYLALGELLDKTGEKIADMLGVEAALVTSGCTGALVLAGAACMTGKDVEKIQRLPDVTGMPYEFIVQRQLRNSYERSMTLAGGKLVIVGDTEETRPEHIEAAIGPNTAGIFYVAPGNSPGALPIEAVIRIGHAHNIPIVVDAAGRVYPTENLSKYAKMGADLVGYGGKYFGAFNSSGLLVGRTDLVEAAKLHNFMAFETMPGFMPFGRAMKLDRQEIVGTYVALREWLTMNHEDRLLAYDARVSALRADLSGIPNIELVNVPEQGPAEGLRVMVNAEKLGKTAADVVEELQASNPRIVVSPEKDSNSFVIGMRTLKEGGEKVITNRLKEIL